MNAPLRKGWCPGALRPMAAKDGLLVRLRITGGILPAATAHTLANLAQRCGNGLFDLSARGNLQMRGITEATLPALHDGLLALNLLNATIAAESVRNVITSPLAGLHAGLDIRPIAAALEAQLADDMALHALPSKFGFLVDDGSKPTLASVDADLRFDWIGDGFSIGLGGDRTSAVRIGMCNPDAVIDHATHVANAFLSLARKNAEVRRMRDVACEVSSSNGKSDDISSLPSVPLARACDIVGFRTISALSWLGLAAPFGRLDADMLHAAAHVAETTSLGELRLTPFRTILVPGAAGSIHLPGFITDAADPRLAVAACVGASGCARGTTNTHDDATALAAALPTASGIMLHVSGCEKGCAKASPTPVTLVARDGRYGLIRNGRASDPPVRRNLDYAAALAAIRSCA